MGDELVVNIFQTSGLILAFLSLIPSIFKDAKDWVIGAVVGCLLASLAVFIVSTLTLIWG